jgi:hypothetical protein
MGYWDQRQRSGHGSHERTIEVNAGPNSRQPATHYFEVLVSQLLNVLIGVGGWIWGCLSWVLKKLRVARALCPGTTTGNGFALPKQAQSLFRMPNRDAIASRNRGRGAIKGVIVREESDRWTTSGPLHLSKVFIGQLLNLQLDVGGLAWGGHGVCSDLHPAWPNHRGITSDFRPYPAASRKWVLRLQAFACVVVPLNQTAL